MIAPQSLIRSYQFIKEKHQGILYWFCMFLDKKADKLIATLTASDVSQFRGRLARELSTASANLGLKTLRACLGTAHKQALLTSNPAALMDKIRTHRR